MHIFSALLLTFVALSTCGGLVALWLLRRVDQRLKGLAVELPRVM